MPEALDVLAGRYELAEVVARGGMATVWRATDRILARPVAVKILHPDLGEDETFLERFRREALAAASLTHPHIVAIYDTGEDPAGPNGRCHYIVMEHCGGGTLATLLRAEGPLEPGRVVDVGSTICDALGYAHSKGIVHRDVKPANVLVGDDRVLKVGDFGIAKAAAASRDITTTGAIMGTVAYISPEYASDRELDARSDIYSLGVVLYELAVGRPPFEETTSLATAMKHLNEVPAPPRARRAGIPRPLESVIMKALEKDPDRRFASADEMKEALRSIGGSPSTQVLRTTSAEPAGPAISSFRSESRWITPVVALIVGAVVLAMIVAALFDDSGSNGSGDGRIGGGRSGTELEIATAEDFDPYGSSGEHPEEVPLASDGDQSTAWTTQEYQTSLADQDKPGVGLLFDLGETADVARIEVLTLDNELEIEVWAGDERPTTQTDLELVIDSILISGGATLEPATAARYWLVWIVELPGATSGNASIAEVRFFGE